MVVQINEMALALRCLEEKDVDLPLEQDALFLSHRRLERNEEQATLCL